MDNLFKTYNECIAMTVPIRRTCIIVSKDIQTVLPNNTSNLAGYREHELFDIKTFIPDLA